ncbi:MAG: hypothetical protein ACOVLI_02910 [Rhabdaerophilum sp.]|jgi:hypothetical protein
MRIAPGLAASLALMGSALAAPQKPVPGRYAVDAASCATKDFFLTVKVNGFESSVFSCEGLTLYLRGEAGDRTLWQVDGRQCRGLHAGSGGPKRFQMEVMPNRLRIAWPDGTPASTFLRCSP